MTDYTATLDLLLEFMDRDGNAEGAAAVRALRERVRELEDTIRLREANDDLHRSCGRNERAERTLRTIYARHGYDWSGAVVAPETGEAELKCICLDKTDPEWGRIIIRVPLCPVHGRKED